MQNFIQILYAVEVIPDQYEGNDKGKATPLQARTGAECSRRLRLSDVKTIGT
jgi:hypothetical protein